MSAGPDLRASMLEKAIAIAVDAHRGTTDKSGQPYVLHPLRMMLRLTRPEERIVAVLHDVVEDTPWTMEQIRDAGFPDHILDALDRVTQRDGEPYEEFVERSAGNPISRAVKIADIEDNMDVRRLDSITARTADRLEKYLRAWRRLTETPDPGPTASQAPR